MNYMKIFKLLLALFLFVSILPSQSASATSTPEQVKYEVEVTNQENYYSEEKVNIGGVDYSFIDQYKDGVRTITTTGGGETSTVIVNENKNEVYQDGERMDENAWFFYNSVGVDIVAPLQPDVITPTYSTMSTYNTRWKQVSVSYGGYKFRDATVPIIAAAIAASVTKDVNKAALVAIAATILTSFISSKFDIYWVTYKDKSLNPPPKFTFHRYSTHYFKKSNYTQRITGVSWKVGQNFY
ncbi:hypothetical protein [Sutcliffiella horikoshii]|uniref:hypothetical protein n=1 Tax=Sutcliffiella horikoshii TaxID=79883 RepID=UPI00384B599A